VKVFSMDMPIQLESILIDLVKQGHFPSKSEAARALILIGLVEYLKQYYAIKEAEADVRAPTP
jgi:Arc/MetJ-type ribon-helix-helix transcriptional regulator